MCTRCLRLLAANGPAAVCMREAVYFIFASFLPSNHTSLTTSSEEVKQELVGVAFELTMKGWLAGALARIIAPHFPI